MKFFITLFCLTMVRGLKTASQTPKIAIIGGGIGGTSCAYFLKSLFNESDVFIDVFEAEKVGGRLSVVNFGGKLFEEGGSIIHSRNKYMVNFLNEFGLRKRETTSGYFALYNGKELVFSESEWELVTVWKLIYRYGFGFLKLRYYIEDMLKKFEKIYELQNARITFNTVGSMLSAMDPKFADYLHMSTKFGFQSQGISKIVVDEIVMATIRANYGQDLNIQKMVGSVSVAGAIGQLWAVHGGNFKVAEHLLKSSNANLISQPVSTVKRAPCGRIQVRTEQDEEEEGRLYDVIILAAPQTADAKYRIKFEGFDEEIKFMGKYHKTVCTLIEGNLSGSYFRDRNPIIDEILTVTTEAQFNSVGRITSVDYTPKKYNQSNVWKIFTQCEMSDSQINKLFSEVRNKYVREWLAYPHYDHSFRNDSFVLAHGLYHINAIEWAASAMEMSVIGAKNVALLAHKQLTDDKSSRFRQEDSVPHRTEL